MIRWNKLNLFLFLSLIVQALHSQDLYDESHVRKFAEYLYQGRQFDFAAQEFDRLVFMNPSNNEYKLKAIRCYRLGGKLDAATKSFSAYSGDSLCQLGRPAANEFFGLAFARDSLAEAQQFLNCNRRLDDSTRLFYQTCIYLLSHEWKRADLLVQQNSSLNNRFGSLTRAAMNIPYKSPALAAGLSVILPGSGKAYSGYWKDGIISFVFVAVNVFQSYRGFSIYGPDHANGWIFGGLALGFYTGNIYGSAKAALRHNRNSNELIYTRARNIVNYNLE